MIEIKNRYTDEIIIAVDVETIKEAVEYAVKNNISLQNANLAGANMSWADMSGADMVGANMSGANMSWANMSGAYMSWANMSGANMSWASMVGASMVGASMVGANMSGANMSWANMSRANMSGANMVWADMSGADMSGADLFRAIGINKYLTHPLFGLFDSDSNHAYKLVNDKNEGPVKGGIKYEISQEYEVTDTCMDENKDCAEGINLGTIDWVCREYKSGYKIFVVEFKTKLEDGTPNVCVPLGTDGKFRVRKCKIVREKDLKELGLK